MRGSIFLIFTILLSNFAFSQVDPNDSLSKKVQADQALTKKQDSILHATLHFYRAYIPKFVSNVKRASIYINDSLVHELRGNTVASFTVIKEGKIRVAVDKKQQTEIEFKVKFGKEYFFKVEVFGGVFNTKVTIESVTPAVGREETGMLEKEGNQ